MRIINKHEKSKILKIHTVVIAFSRGIFQVAKNIISVEVMETFNQ